MASFSKTAVALAGISAARVASGMSSDRPEHTLPGMLSDLPENTLPGMPMHLGGGQSADPPEHTRPGMPLDRGGGQSASSGSTPRPSDSGGTTALEDQVQASTGPVPQEAGGPMTGFLFHVRHPLKGAQEEVDRAQKEVDKAEERVREAEKKKYEAKKRPVDELLEKKNRAQEKFDAARKAEEVKKCEAELEAAEKREEEARKAADDEEEESNPEHTCAICLGGCCEPHLPVLKETGNVCACAPRFHEHCLKESGTGKCPTCNQPKIMEESKLVPWGKDSESPEERSAAVNGKLGRRSHIAAMRDARCVYTKI